MSQERSLIANSMIAPPPGLEHLAAELPVFLPLNVNTGSKKAHRSRSPMKVDLPKPLAQLMMEQSDWTKQHSSVRVSPLIVGVLKGRGCEAADMFLKGAALFERDDASTRASSREPVCQESASQDSLEDHCSRSLHLDDAIAVDEDSVHGRHRRQKGWRGLPSKVKKHLVKNGIDSNFWTALIKEEDVPVDLKERVQHAFRRQDELRDLSSSCLPFGASCTVESDSNSALSGRHLNAKVQTHRVLQANA